MLEQVRRHSSRLSALALWLIATLWLAGCGESAPKAPQASPYAPVVSEHPYANPSPRPATPPVAVQAAPEEVPNYPTVKVALLLPLSGASEHLGGAMLDAATLALFDKYESMPKGDARTRIILLPKDTQGKPEQAAAMAKEALSEGAVMILGPLYSDEVHAVAPLARKAGVPVLSFSNNETVAGKGVYLFGFMPRQQVSRVLEHALAQGMTHIAAFLPASEYGTLLEDTLLEFMALHGMQPSGVVQYQPDAEDLGVFAQRLIGVEGISTQQRSVDALLLAEGGTGLERLAARLNAFKLGADRVTYLGTALWDDPSLFTNPALRGSLFSSAPVHAFESFAARFEATQGYTPPRLAALGYDAVAFAATLAGAPGGFSDATLTARAGYDGSAAGLFRLRADGTNERGLSVLRMEGDGRVSEVGSAPRAFVE